ncbi:hypothetical protein GYH30_014029, partial [Glycine max]
PQHPNEVPNQIWNLTDWDIAMLSTNYIQKGLLFKKPATLVDQQDFMENLLEKLKRSLSLTLSHFYPLALLTSHSFVQPLFDQHKALNHDDYTMPLLSIQVTELVDAVFIGCSMNHVIGHATDVPIDNRWFPKDCAPPINLPFKHHDEIISRYETPLLR